jgi:multidrug efflux pump subunit AcrA (membrane-fusion protein)
VDDRAVTELRRLAELDRSLSERASALRELDGRVARIRARAEAIDAFFAAYPERETQARAEVSEAEAELERRGDERATAERTLAEAQDEEARIQAGHALARSLDHIAVAESRLGRADAEHEGLEREAAVLPRELDELEAEARAVPDVPVFGSSLVEWASHAHAELFVAAGQIDVQRERVIREAHELATMLLGETTYGATVAQSLGRVEAHWTSSPGHVSESR